MGEPAFLSIPAVNNINTQQTSTQAPVFAPQQQNQFTSFRARAPPAVPQQQQQQQQPSFSSISSLSRIEPAFAPQAREDSSFSLAQSRSEPSFSSSLSRTESSAPTPAPSVTERFSFGRQSPTSVSLQDDDQKQMTQRAKTALKRTLIQKFNIRAENEGDAIEKLRLRLENSQNRNRARG